MAGPPPRNPPGSGSTCGGFGSPRAPLPSTCSYGTPDSTIKSMDGCKSTGRPNHRRTDMDLSQSMMHEIPNRVPKKTAQWSKGKNFLRSSYPFAIALLPPALSARHAPWSVDGNRFRRWFDPPSSRPFLLTACFFSNPFEPVMAAFQLARPGLSLALRLRRSYPLHRRSSSFLVRCRLQEDGGESKGEERPESLFMKELKRRGLNPTTLLEEGDGGALIGESRDGGERNGGSTKRNGMASAELGRRLSNQRELSMSLNSEGLEGLIPRAKLLLTIGGTFFLGFWPLILITFGLFLALYIYLGPSFVHDASRAPASPPPYIDPYALLDKERLSQVAPNLY